MSDTRNRAAEAPAVDLNPVARVTTERNRLVSGPQVVRDVEIAAVKPHKLSCDDPLYSADQVAEFERRARQEGYDQGRVDSAKVVVAQHEDRLNGVYYERNQLAIALARLTLMHSDYAGTPESVDDPKAGYGFDEKTGRAVVYVTLPMGHQVSWHMDDKTTERFRRMGTKPLPRFQGEWDGTFLGREHNWPTKYVRKEKSFCEQARERFKNAGPMPVGGFPPAPDPHKPGVITLPFTLPESRVTIQADGWGINSVGTITIKATGEDGQYTFAGIGAGFHVDSAPQGATHYRICTNGNRRHYKKQGGVWQYWHAKDNLWHPTDLDDSYLESHVISLADAETTARADADAILAELSAQITNSDLSAIQGAEQDKPLTIQRDAVAALYSGLAGGQEFGYCVANNVTHVDLNVEQYDKTVFYRIRESDGDRLVEWLDFRGDSYPGQWQPSVARPSWVEKNCHRVVVK